MEVSMLGRILVVTLAVGTVAASNAALARSDVVIPHPDMRRTIHVND
jgi:hypothetical protein